MTDELEIPNPLGEDETSISNEVPAQDEPVKASEESAETVVEAEPEWVEIPVPEVAAKTTASPEPVVIDSPASEAVPPKKDNTVWWVVGSILLVLFLCCCCVILVIAWFTGDVFMEALNSMSALPHLFGQLL